MAGEQVEVKFAKNLADNEKPVRDKALRKLKKFLRLKSGKKDGFKEEDFLKLWKGLHYSMWMQDKPLIQEELSSRLSTLVHELEKPDSRFLFIRTYFVTEVREWNSIDIWRIDKFMMLMRNVLHEMFVLGEKDSWSDETISQIAGILTGTVLDHKNDSVLDGIRTHIADIFLAELNKVNTEKLEKTRVLKLLEPFVSYILKAQNTVVVKRMISRVFDPIISLAEEFLRRKIGGAKKGRSMKNEEDMEAGSTKKKKFEVKEGVVAQKGPTAHLLELPPLYDFKLLADHLLQLSEGKDCLTRNRPLVYDIVRRLQDIEAGVLPKKEKIVIKPGLTSKEFNEAVESVIRLEDSGRKVKRKWKKKDMRSKENLDANNNQDDSDKSDYDTDSLPEKEDNLRKEKGDNRSKRNKIDSDRDSSSENKYQKRKHFSGTDNLPSKNVKRTPKKKEHVLPSHTSKNVTFSKSLGDEIQSSIVDSSVSGHKSKETERKKENISHSPAKRTKIEATSSEYDGQDANADLQEGEIEIWIPSKKYKEKKSCSSGFAKFEKTKTPAAFVKRALTKLKNPSVSQRGKVTEETTPGKTKEPASVKKVQFNMKKNKALDFKASLLISPVLPFHPDKKPDQGILKSSPEVMSQRSSPGQRKHSLTLGGKLLLDKERRKSMPTPVTALTTKQKMKSLTRARATDFFL